MLRKDPSPSDGIAALIDEEEIGGVIVSVGTPTDIATKLNVLQQRSDLPLLVAADLETGAGFRMRGAVYLPEAIDLGGASDFSFPDGSGRHSGPHPSRMRWVGLLQKRRVP